MKTINNTSSPLAILALCFALATGVKTVGQGYQAPTTSTEPQPKQEIPAATSQPAKFNKASGIIGMEVRNDKAQRLGEIRDVVFDLESEKVAYAVMNTGGFLSGGGKLLAVPLNAFTPATDQKHLVLRADKAKVEAAEGIDRNSWPSLNNPSWGAEPFWDKPGSSDIFGRPDKRSDLRPKDTDLPKKDGDLPQKQQPEPGPTPDRP